MREEPGLVAARVKATSGRISAKRLLPAARAAGYAGSARNFRRLVAEARRAWRAEHHRGRRPAVWSPGEHLVIDWGAESGLHLFCAVPAERLVIERELLAPLPSLRASIGKLVTRKVDRLSCVRFASARYSVPARLIGTEVGLRTGDGRLLVIVTATGEVVAEHILVAPGEASVRDEHYGGPRPDTPRRAVRPKTVAEKQFCALGPVAEAFITGAAASGATRLPAELAELNTLRAAHGEEAFLAALDRAVAFCRWRAAGVRSILAAGAGVPEPKVAAGDALTLDLPAVPIRPLADYAIGALS